MSASAEFEQLTLANACDGMLETQFQDALAELADVLENAGLFETTKEGALCSRITLELDITRHPDSNALGLESRATLKRPRRRRSGRTVFYSAGSFHQPTFHQTPLFPAGVSRLRRHEEGSSHE